MFSRPNDRIIVALDVPSSKQAWSAVNILSEHGLVGGYKIGYELFYGAAIDSLLASGGHTLNTPLLYETGGFFRYLAGLAFIDLKFNDIPETVRKAVGQALRLKPKFLNLHANGGKKMMLAAHEAREKFLAEHPFPDGHRPKLLAVTVLTSLNYKDFVNDGVFDPIEERFLLGSSSRPETVAEDAARMEKREIERVVVKRAKNAQECGLDGVIASAQEAAAIRKVCGTNFLIVTPAIRPLWAAIGDQKRPTTPRDAIAAGADYLVIGRPILQPPAEIGSLKKAVELICEEIEKATAQPDRSRKE